MTPEFRIPELETERLRLRLPRMDDFETFAAFRASERSNGVGGPYDRATSFHHLAGIVGQWQLRGYGRWLVADKTTDEPYGIAGIYHPEDWPEPELGWSIFAPAEGRGMAHEAARATRDFVYRTLGWDRIVSLITDGNARSIRLAERMGCTRTGVFKHHHLGKLNIWLHPKPEALA